MIESYLLTGPGGMLLVILGIFNESLSADCETGYGLPI